MNQKFSNLIMIFFPDTELSIQSIKTPSTHKRLWFPNSYSKGQFKLILFQPQTINLFNSSE